MTFNASFEGDSHEQNSKSQLQSDGPSPTPGKARADSGSLDPQAQLETLELRTNRTKVITTHNSKHLEETKDLAADKETGDFSSSEFGVTEDPTTKHGTNAQTIHVSSSRRRLSASQETPQQIGAYEVKGVLGQGGMGVVYWARQTSLNRDVALKMVLAGAHATSAQLSRFRSEAQAVAQLQHPNIVQVFEVGEHEGLPFFSLEYVDGLSLDKKIAGQPLPPREAAELAESVCRALQFAHSRGILHRDIKPANILLTPNGQPKITDFGLAKQLDDGDSASTKTGTIMGTPSYMSPEQAQGLVHELTAASDQYSVGALFYELLTGRPPFLGTKAIDTISQVVRKEPIPPCQLQEQLPRDLDTICLKALQKIPEKRYASCQEMADDLARFLRGEPIMARPISRTERLWRWCRRNPLIAAPTATAALLLVAITFVSGWAYFQIAQERDTANLEKKEADRQRILANEATLQAEKDKRTAERQAELALENIQFVLTQIDDRLTKQPSTEKLRIDLLNVLQEKWDTVEVELVGGVAGQAIPTLMAIRERIASAWANVDEIEKSDIQFSKAYEQGKDRLIIKNRSDFARINLALLCSKWAPIRMRLTGDPAEADRLIAEADSLFRETLASPRPEPGGPSPYKIAANFSRSLLQSAGADMVVGKLQAARDRFNEVEQISIEVLNSIEETPAPVWLAELTPNEQIEAKVTLSEYRDLGRAGVANVLYRQGQTEQAISISESVIANRREVVQKHPENPNARDQLSIQLYHFGRNMLRAGKYDQAVHLLGQAHHLSEQNHLEAPDNAYYKKIHSRNLYYWGVARDANGQKEDAIALLERSRVIRRRMLEISPDSSNQANLLLTEARLGNWDASQTLLTELAKFKAKNADLKLDRARANAQLYRLVDDVNQKAIALEAGLTALEMSVGDGLKDTFAITHEIDLFPLNQQPRYAAVVEKLQSGNP